MRSPRCRTRQRGNGARGMQGGTQEAVIDGESLDGAGGEVELLVEVAVGAPQSVVVGLEPGVSNGVTGGALPHS